MSRDQLIEALRSVLQEARDDVRLGEPIMQILPADLKATPDGRIWIDVERVVAYLIDGLTEVPERERQAGEVSSSFKM